MFEEWGRWSHGGAKLCSESRWRLDIVGLYPSQGCVGLFVGADHCLGLVDSTHALEAAEDSLTPITKRMIWLYIPKKLPIPCEKVLRPSNTVPCLVRWYLEP